MTLNTGFVCRSLDETSGTGAYGGTITQSAAAVCSIGDGTSGAGNVALKLTAGAIFTRSTTATINFVSTNGTAQSITCAGEDLSNVTFNGAGGSWTCTDAFSASGRLITLTSGTLTTGAFTHDWGQFASSGSLTRALNISGSTINGLAVVQPWNINATGMTFTSTGSTLNVANVSGTFTSGGLSYGTVNFTTITGLEAIAGGGTYVNLSAASTNITGTFRLALDLTITGTLTLGGASTQGFNRLLVFAATPGVTRTFIMTGAAVVINGDVDFQDIDITGSPSWTNAGSAWVGDGVGNGSLIVTNRTTPATQTAVGTTGFNWSTAASWTSRAPLPQDDVVINNAFSGGQTISVNMTRLGKNIDASGATGSPIFLTNRAVGNYGSLAFPTGATCTGTDAWTLAGRGTVNITTAGVSIANPMTVVNVGGTTNLLDAFTTTEDFSVTDGTFNTTNFNISCLTFGAASARDTTLNFGTSTITITQTTAVTVYNTGATLTTTNGSSATLVIANASTNNRQISLSNHTLGTLTYTVAASPGLLDVRPSSGGSSTINTLNIGSGRSLQMFSGRTLNIGTTFNVNGAVNGYVRLPGVASRYISAPDSAPLSITSDITVLVRLSMDDWTPSASSTVAAKYNGTTQRSWFMFVDTAGKINFRLSSDGAAIVTALSSVAPTIADGAALWVLASWRNSDDRCQFFTASGAIANPVASDFTQLGTDQSIAVTGIFNSTAAVEIGSTTDGTTVLNTGNFYRAMIYDGVFSTAAFAGTLQFDANLAAKTVGANTFTESSANAATVTINGVLAQVGDGRIAITASTPASVATLSSPTRIAVDYVTVQDNTAAGNIPFYAGSHGVLVSGTTNWLAIDKPGGGLIMMGVGG